VPVSDICFVSFCCYASRMEFRVPRALVTSFACFLGIILSHTAGRRTYAGNHHVTIIFFSQKAHPTFSHRQHYLYLLQSNSPKGILSDVTELVCRDLRTIRNIFYQISKSIDQVHKQLRIQFQGKKKLRALLELAQCRVTTQISNPANHIIPFKLCDGFRAH
jgi:hypothetical protein